MNGSQLTEAATTTLSDAGGVNNSPGIRAECEESTMPFVTTDDGVEIFYGNMPFQPGEWCSDAVVQTVPEGYVPARIASRVEHVGLGEASSISVGARERSQNEVAGADVVVPEAEVLGRYAQGGGLQRRLVSQGLLDVGLELGLVQWRTFRHHFGLGEKCVEGVADQVRGGLVPCNEQECDR